MKFSFSLVNSVWRNYIVPLQCANIINNYWLRIVQMPRTRSTGAGDDDDLPSPPPPTPTELMVILAKGQHTMAEALHMIANHDGRGPCQGPELNQYSDFKDFLDTKPPIFKEAEEPLQANEWLNTLEQKFRLLRLIEVLKTEYASHQLHGPAGIWWSHHRSTMPANAQITLDQFKSALRGNYIPSGLMAIKHMEVMKLT